MSSTAEQTDFLVNLRLHLIDLSRRLEQDSSDAVADYVLYRLQQVARHLSRIAACAPGNVFEEVQLSFSEITSVLEDAERNWQCKMGLTGLRDSPARVLAYFIIWLLRVYLLSERPLFVRSEGRILVDFSQQWLLFYGMPVFPDAFI